MNVRSPRSQPLTHPCRPHAYNWSTDYVCNCSRSFDKCGNRRRIAYHHRGDGSRAPREASAIPAAGRWWNRRHGPLTRGSAAPFDGDEAAFEEQWLDGWTIDMYSRPAFQVPATLGTNGSVDVLDGTEPFRAAAAVVWLHSSAETAFGSGLITEAASDLLPGASRTLLASSSVACLRRLQ
jgi:hypothetical protein